MIPPGRIRPRPSGGLGCRQRPGRRELSGLCGAGLSHTGDAGRLKANQRLKITIPFTQGLVGRVSKPLVRFH
jgi:hypothetical protein